MHAWHSFRNIAWARPAAWGVVWAPPYTPGGWSGSRHCFLLEFGHHVDTLLEMFLLQYCRNQAHFAFNTEGDKTNKRKVSDRSVFESHSVRNSNKKNFTQIPLRSLTAILNIDLKQGNYFLIECRTPATTIITDASRLHDHSDCMNVARKKNCLPPGVNS